MWFKENAKVGLHEGPVQQILARLAPAFVDVPLAADPARGWLLTRDQGVTVDRAVPVGKQLPISLLAELVSDYARLQRRTLAAGPELLAAGLPSARPAETIPLLESTVSMVAGYPPNDARHLGPEDAGRLLAQRERLNRAATLLATGPIGCTLQHNDLSPGNVFERQPEGHFRFFDFAESLWAHPFGSMLTVQWLLLNRFGRQPAANGPVDLSHKEILHVLRAYLSVWSDFGDADILEPLLAAALELAPLQRVMAWLQVLDGAPDDVVAKHGATAKEWLLDLTRPVLLAGRGAGMSANGL